MSTAAANNIPIKQRPTLKLKLGSSPVPVGKPDVDRGGSVEVVPPATPVGNPPPVADAAPANVLRNSDSVSPTLNEVEIAGRARRAERRAAVAAEAAETERRATEKAARIERQAGKEAKLQRVFQMLDVLYERWPALFKMSGPRPAMAVGIHRDIIAAAPDLHAGDVRKAVRYYALSGNYIEAVVAGAVRYNLYGQPAGVVTETEARWPIKRREPVIKGSSELAASSTSCPESGLWNRPLP